MANERPAEPWFSFLTELDLLLAEPVDLHCLGGFVVSQCYGLGRETADSDVLMAAPRAAMQPVLALAGKGSESQRRHRVYVDYCGVAQYPESYETRLTRVFPIWGRVRLWALEPHDLALTKLDRSIERDVRDVMYLAQAGLIQQDVLVERFAAEWEPYMVGKTPTWHRTTLRMWIAACWPDGV